MCTSPAGFGLNTLTNTCGWSGAPATMIYYGSLYTNQIKKVKLKDLVQVGFMQNVQFAKCAICKMLKQSSNNQNRDFENEGFLK